MCRVGVVAFAVAGYGSVGTADPLDEPAFTAMVVLPIDACHRVQDAQLGPTSRDFAARRRARLHAGP